MPGSQCNQGRPSPNDRKELEDKSYRVLALWWVNNLEIPIRINELSKAATCSLTFIHWLFPLPCLLPHSANRLPGDHLPNKPVELKFVPRSVSGAWGGGGAIKPKMVGKRSDTKKQTLRVGFWNWILLQPQHFGCEGDIVKIFIIAVDSHVLRSSRMVYLDRIIGGKAQNCVVALGLERYGHSSKCKDCRLPWNLSRKKRRLGSTSYQFRAWWGCQEVSIVICKELLSPEGREKVMLNIRAQDFIVRMAELWRRLNAQPGPSPLLIVENLELLIPSERYESTEADFALLLLGINLVAWRSANRIPKEQALKKSPFVLLRVCLCCLSLSREREWGSRFSMTWTGKCYSCQEKKVVVFEKSYRAQLVCSGMMWENISGLWGWWTKEAEIEAL